MVYTMSETTQLTIESAEVRTSNIDDDSPQVQKIALFTTDGVIERVTVKPRREVEEGQLVDGVQVTTPKKVPKTVPELNDEHPTLMNIVEEVQSGESVTVEAEVSTFYSEDNDTTYYYVDRDHIDTLKVVG